MSTVRTFVILIASLALTFGAFTSSAWADAEPPPKESGGAVNPNAVKGKDAKPDAAKEKPAATTDKPAAGKAPAKTEPAATDTKKRRKRPKKYRSDKRIPCEHGLGMGKWDGHCEDEFRKDKVWQAQWKSVLKKDLKPEVHETESRRFATNNKHVVMAYVAIWLIVVGLFVMMWLRQSKLMEEISRLESELKKVSDEG